MKRYWVEQKTFEFLRCNWINWFFLHLCEKSDIDEQRGHKVVTVMSIEFDLLLLVKLQWFHWTWKIGNVPSILYPHCLNIFMMNYSMINSKNWKISVPFVSKLFLKAIDRCIIIHFWYWSDIQFTTKNVCSQLFNANSII